MVIGYPHIPGVAAAVRKVAKAGQFAPKDVRELLIVRGAVDPSEWWEMYIVPKRIDTELRRAIERGHVEKLGYGLYAGTAALS